MDILLFLMIPRNRKSENKTFKTEKSLWFYRLYIIMYTNPLPVAGYVLLSRRTKKILRTLSYCPEDIYFVKEQVHHFT